MTIVQRELSEERKEYFREMLEICPLVFTYGTLKKGEWNSSLLGESEWLGEHTTVTEHVMGDVGFPYVFDTSGTLAVPDLTNYHKPVTGHLWRVESVEVFSRLDGLEGYPRHYDREIVALSDDKLAWMYIQRDLENLWRCALPHSVEEATWNWRP